MSNKLNEEQRLQRAHVWLMSSKKYCLYSGVFMLGESTVSDKVPTAGTDGFNKWYGRDFIGTLSDKELRAIVLHENLHVALQHLTNWKPLYDENPELANAACDYVINLMIYDSDPAGDNVKLPEGGCFDGAYRGMDAAQVFKLLKQKIDGQGQGQGQGEGGKGFDEHDWDAAGQANKEQKQEQAKQVDQALRQGVIMAGKRKAEVPRELLDALAPPVDWREVLREFIANTCADRSISTWRRPNRRWIDQDIYMPSTYGEAVGPLVVGVDTSGSIGGKELGIFLAVLADICVSVNPESVDLLYWGSEVVGHEVYTQGNYDMMRSSTKPVGGGGTNPAKIPPYIARKQLKPEAAIILTDGYFSDPGVWPMPVVWVLTSDRVVGVGTNVRLRDG